MTWKLYDYVDSKGINRIKVWSDDLEKIPLAKLNRRLDALETAGSNLPPGLLAGTNIPGIQKIKIQGNVKLRPLLCYGPINVKAEFTLLIGAKEVQWKFVPKNADNIAANRRAEILNDHSRRREHEPVEF